MTGFSMAPLQFFSVLGMLIAAGSVLLFVALMAERMLLGAEPARGLFTLFAHPGFFLIGLQLFGIGLLGEYVGRIYEEVRQRPRYVVGAVLQREE